MYHINLFELFTKFGISQSVFNQLTCSWATFEGVIEGRKRPVFLQSLILDFQRPRLLVQSWSSLFLVFFQSSQSTTLDNSLNNVYLNLQLHGALDDTLASHIMTIHSKCNANV